jgi:hypothetical protein
MSRTLRVATAVGLLALSPALMAAKNGSNLVQKIAGYARQTDVNWQYPVGKPSPMMGSFVKRYVPADPAHPDPTKVGTFEVAPSVCAQHLVTERVVADETSKEVVIADTQIGLSLGLQSFDIGGTYGRKALGGMEYDLTEKTILKNPAEDPKAAEGWEKFEACCVEMPSRCEGGEIVSEWWKGTGAVYRLIDSKASIAGAVSQLAKVAGINADFKTTKSWSMAKDWGSPQYFAYRTQKVRIPSCEEYMNSSPELADKVRFTGVSDWIGSEPSARGGARDDARKQVVEYLGVEYKLTGDQVAKAAEAVLSGVKDDLTCVDKMPSASTGTAFQSRVRMYVDKARLDEAVATMRSAK